MCTIAQHPIQLKEVTEHLRHNKAEDAYKASLGSLQELLKVLETETHEQRLQAIALIYRFMGIIESVLSNETSAYPPSLSRPTAERNDETISIHTELQENISVPTDGESHSGDKQGSASETFSFLDKPTPIIIKREPEIPVSPLLIKYLELSKDTNVDSEPVLTITALEHDTTINNSKISLVPASGHADKILTQFYLSCYILSTRSFRAPVIAYYLTLIEHELFCKIDPLDMLKHKPPNNPSPNIHSSSEFFNYLTRMIEHSIIEPESANDRALVISAWIKIGSCLESFRNFQTLKAVLSAMGTPPITRLKKTWTLVPKKSMSVMKSMQDFLSENDNYKSYRSWLQVHATRPMVPYFGLFLHDFTYLKALAKAENIEPAFDPKILKLFQQISFFQSGPKYAPLDRYSSTGNTGIIGSVNALSLMLGKKTPFRDHLPLPVQSFLKGLNDKELGEIVTHWLLSRSWFDDSEIDELSMAREPKVASDAGSTLNGSSSTNLLISNQSVVNNAKLDVDKVFLPVEGPTVSYIPGIVPPETELVFTQTGRGGLDFIQKNKILFPPDLFMSYPHDILNSSGGSSSFLRRAASSASRRSGNGSALALPQAGFESHSRSSTGSVHGRKSTGNHSRQKSVPTVEIHLTTKPFEILETIPSSIGLDISPQTDISPSSDISWNSTLVKEQPTESLSLEGSLEESRASSFRGLESCGPQIHRHRSLSTGEKIVKGISKVVHGDKPWGSSWKKPKLPPDQAHKPVPISNAQGTEVSQKMPKSTTEEELV